MESIIELLSSIRSLLDYVQGGRKRPDAYRKMLEVCEGICAQTSDQFILRRVDRLQGLAIAYYGDKADPQRADELLETIRQELSELDYEMEKLAYLGNQQLPSSKTVR